jgi:serine/threonine protein phosphatase 1
MGKTYVIGDIHGELDKLESCLAKVNFDYKDDELISLGDVSDRGNETKECIDKLLEINNFILIKGNHDQWALNWMVDGVAPLNWLVAGGMVTIESYTNPPEEGLENFRKLELDKGSFVDYVSESHRTLLSGAIPFYIDSNNRFFTHGGFDPETPFNSQDPGSFMWDRKLLQLCMNETMVVKEFSEVFIGHTNTLKFEKTTPIHAGNLWNLDTGAGYKKGKLTIMDVESKEYWQG